MLNLDKRWLAFLILCLGDMMIILDTTIVNVALPSIHTDLGFTETSLVWVVNAYMIAFGGFLLLGGRLGDLYGPRKLFIIGTVLFTLASLACGLSQTQLMLIIARAIQGLGAAIVAAVVLSLIMHMFQTPKDRAKAMGFFGFVGAGGGAVGVFLGGVLTDLLSWHWIFLVNLPIGIAVVIFTALYIPKDKAQKKKQVLDVWGAITITLSLIIAVYAIVDGNTQGWDSLQTLGLLALSVAIFLVFLITESKVRNPLVPLSLFSHKTLAVSNIIGMLWAIAMFAWFFLSALYMQLILGYSPLQVGLAFLPTNLIMGALSLGISAIIVMRFGLRLPASVGMGLAGLGLLLFSFAPTNGQFLIHVLPGMILLGIGAGITFNPLLLAAMGDVKKSESGLASGTINTSFMMGGALGLAILASLAAAITSNMVLNGIDNTAALNAGYQAAFLLGAVLSFVASGLSLMLPKKQKGNASAH